jgi:hypothetical protein
VSRVADDLRAAAEVLRRDGWTQYTSHRETTGEHCAAGAIEVVVDPAWNEFPRLGWSEEENLRFSAATQALQAHIGTEVTRWNDQNGQTAECVVAGLLAAAEQAEGES